MKTPVLYGTILLPILLVAATPAKCLDEVRRDTIRRTLNFSGPESSRHLVVENINGEIRVTGYDGKTVELVAYQTIRAESEGRLERARENVNLDIREDAERIVVYVDGPWRGENGRSRHRGWEHEGYEVIFDFELRVPSRSDFTLKTINGGNITVRNMRGSFSVRNVNGNIDMRDIDGSGSATTVNGDVEVAFARNPGSATEFRTVNGEIEASFPSTPSADMRFKTLNGEVYSDFDVKSLPVKITAKEKRGGKKVYGSGGSFLVASGGGGPELSFNTLNGNIYLSLKGERK